MPIHFGSNQPVYAEVCEEKENKGKSNTIVKLCIFGKNVEKEFSGPGHCVRAAAWANNWNIHLEKEWMCIKETTADIMQDFINALRKAGVEKKEIDSALNEVKTHAKS